MHWEIGFRTGDLHLTHCTAEQRAVAEAAVDAFGRSGHTKAARTAGKIQAALAEDRLPWEVQVSLSRWCHTDPTGNYQFGMGKAEEVSRALFEGRILPQLATDELRRDLDRLTARERMREFLAGLEPSGPKPIGGERPSSRESESGAAEVIRRAPAPAPARGRRSGRGGGGAATHGSRYCLQGWVNEAPGELADRILLSSISLTVAGVTSVTWKSPLAAEDYYEYRDDFVIPLRLEEHAPAIRRFWPENGPQWDGLALLGLGRRQGVLLVEAKAHAAECFSRCEASHPDSLAMIEAAFGRVQEFSRLEPADWKEGAYQLANRLAFLQFLNEELQVPTWLALVYFLDDTSHRPTSLAAWRAAAAEPFRRLGIGAECPLLGRVCPVFLPAQP